MYVVRIGFAALLVSLALLLFVDQLLVIRGPQLAHALDHILAFALAFCLVFTGLYYFRSPAYWNSKLACPRCHRKNTLRPSTFGQPRMSLTVWIVGGFIGSLLYSNARKHRLRCEACGELSNIRTTGGWLAAAWLLLLVFALFTAIYVHKDD